MPTKIGLRDQTKKAMRDERAWSFCRNADAPGRAHLQLSDRYDEKRSDEDEGGHPFERRKVCQGRPAKDQFQSRRKPRGDRRGERQSGGKLPIAFGQALDRRMAAKTEGLDAVLSLDAENAQSRHGYNGEEGRQGEP